MKEVSKVTVTALTTVEHDGVKYGPGQEAGETFECSAVQAKALEDVGAVKPTGEDEGGDTATAAAKTATKKK